MAVFDMGQVREVMLPDGTWHNTTGAPVATVNPTFASDTGEPITTPETWISFVDQADGSVYAFPVSAAIAVKYTP